MCTQESDDVYTRIAGPRCTQTDRTAMTANDQLHLRLSTDDLNATRQAARNKGMTVSAYVLMLVRTANEQVLGRQKPAATPVLQELVPTTAAPVKRQALTQEQKLERTLASLTRSQRAQVMAKGFYIDEDGDEVMI